MSKPGFSILVADDNQPNIKTIKSTLAHYNDIEYRFDIARTRKDILAKTDLNKFNLLLMNQSFSGIKGIKVLDEINRRKLDMPVIIIVEEGDEESGVQAMDKGAYDYLTREETKTPALNRAIRRAIQKKKLEDDIRETISKLEKLAIRDGLTGLYNHRHFSEVLKNEYKKAKRHMQPLSCLMIDLDHFKSVNDNYGHQFGDFVLVESAQILLRLVRDTDFVARYGGEEFFIILPNTDMQGAFILGDRIRNIFAHNRFSRDDMSETVTISMGISSTSNNNVLSDNDLVANADKALYFAKRRGRNNVCYFEEIEAENNTINLKEEVKKIEDFYIRLDSISENIKGSCIESAHDILREIESGWDHINEHSIRVSRYVEKLMIKLSMPEAEINIVKHAALLHDIGMVGISSKIIKKKGRLTENEYNLVKRHSQLSVKLIERTRLFQKEIPIILHHHERFDGSGYPYKLKGDAIPVGSRIIAVAEAYDSMMSNNVYRKASSSREAIKELKECAGKQFDPHIVDVFVKVVERSH